MQSDPLIIKKLFKKITSGQMKNYNQKAITLNCSNTELCRNLYFCWSFVPKEHNEMNWFIHTPLQWPKPKPHLLTCEPRAGTEPTQNIFSEARIRFHKNLQAALQTSQHSSIIKQARTLKEILTQLHNLYALSIFAHHHLYLLLMSVN